MPESSLSVGSRGYLTAVKLSTPLKQSLPIKTQGDAAIRDLADKFDKMERDRYRVA